MKTVMYYCRILSMGTFWFVSNQQFLDDLHNKHKVTISYQIDNTEFMMICMMVIK